MFAASVVLGPVRGHAVLPSRLGAVPPEISGVDPVPRRWELVELTMVASKQLLPVPRLRTRMSDNGFNGL
jgi:hypothetical protein